MSPRTRYTLIVLGLNLLLAVLAFLPLFFAGIDDALGWLIIFLLVAAILLVLQLIAGIILAAGKRYKILGQSILLAMGIVLLIGLSVCGTIMGTV